MEQKQPNNPKRFSVALSFPGESRPFIAETAEHLAKVFTKNRILYDKYYEDEFARPNLDTYLPPLYNKESELIVIFLSSDYLGKRWCRLEMRYIKELIQTFEENRIMLLSFDRNCDYSPLGILSGDGYLSIESRSPSEIAKLIINRHTQETKTPIIAGSTIHNAPETEGRNETDENKIERKLVGKKQKRLFDYFTTEWREAGRSVAILQGFAGCGKTLLSRLIEQSFGESAIYLRIQEEAPDPTLELLYDLATSLLNIGISDLIDEMKKGEGADLFSTLNRILTGHRILIIIDDFQTLLTDGEAVPPPEWARTIENISRNYKGHGKLLIVSNHLSRTDRWSNECDVRTMPPLDGDDASTFILCLLRASQREGEIPPERIDEIGLRVAGNPRAIQILIGCLEYDSLEELISLAPDLSKVGDVKLGRDLLAKFEAELIGRILPRIKPETREFLQTISAHRRPFRKDVYSELPTPAHRTDEIRRELIRSYIIETHLGWDSLHPIAREIGISRLRENTLQWRRAHSIAANYHIRHFKAGALADTQNLTKSYSELRHHLCEAGRIAELVLADRRLTNFAISRIPRHLLYQAPSEVEIIQERIVLLSCIPDSIRPSPLEHHLALCLKSRNTANDYSLALTHARKAVGPKAFYASWLLLIELEYHLHGLDAMLLAEERALACLGAGKNSFSVYLFCANLLVNNNKIHDAIALLLRGIETPGVNCLSSLLSHCSELMSNANRVDEAIRLLQKGIIEPSIQDKGRLYADCATLMLNSGRQSEAIKLLELGLDTTDVSRRYSLYLCLSDCMLRDQRPQEAMQCLQTGIRDRLVKDPKELYRALATLMISRGDVECAVAILEDGISSTRVKDSLPLVHTLVQAMEENGNSDYAVKLLKTLASRSRLRPEPSIYLLCAKLLFHSRKIDEAIHIGMQGIRTPGVKEKSSLYKMTAGYMSRCGRTEEGINLLQDGLLGKNINDPATLYITCADLMEKSGRRNEGIKLLLKAIDTPGQRDMAILYRACAKFLAKDGQSDQAIHLLIRAISKPAIPGMVIIYQACGRLLWKQGQSGRAIEILEKCLNGPRLGNIVSIYKLCAEILIADGMEDNAKSVINQGLVYYPNDPGLLHVLQKLYEARSDDR